MVIELETGWRIRHEFRICRVPYIRYPVARGLWHTFSTLGFPMGELMNLLQARGLHPDWAYLVIEMSAEGWSGERIENMIRQEMEGVYPPDISAVIRKALSRLCAPTGK